MRRLLFRRQEISSVRYFATESPIYREYSFPFHSRIDQRTERPSNVDKEIENIILKYQGKKPTPGTLQQLIALSNSKHRLNWGPHVQNEMLVRLTSRIKDFQKLPLSLLAQQQVQSVVGMYRQYLEQLDSLEGTDTPQLNREFIRLLTEFKAKDSTTLPLVASGIQEWRKETNQINIDNDLATHLDDLFTARLSIRMLIGQYCEFANPNTPGKIERGLHVADVVSEARQKVISMSEEKFGLCPEIIIEGNLDSRLTYVRSFLHHILVELIKNSVSATIEKHKGNGKLPIVDVVIAGGKEDCVIKISDEGGGIPRSAMQQIWSYQYTTSISGTDSAKESTFRTNFSGSGYGLPIARVFARYFGGDLHVICTEGWGTDAYIYLKKVESSAVEVLPD